MPESLVVGTRKTDCEPNVLWARRSQSKSACCSDGLTLLFPGKLLWSEGEVVFFLAFLLGLEMILLTRGKESINEGGSCSACEGKSSEVS